MSYSTCGCNAEDRCLPGGDSSYSDHGICPECGAHCEFVDEPLRENNRVMAERELVALEGVIKYLWDDEKRDVEEDGKHVPGHIFHELEILKKFLEKIE